VLVARAIAARPPLLILDEPTAGVDAEQQLMMATTLERLAEDGTTILFVTHELGPFERLFTRAIVMDRGQVAYDGTPLPSHRHHDCGAETHEHGEVSRLPSGLVDWQV
jgi:zinc transport system ATP-binding protein